MGSRGAGRAGPRHRPQLQQRGPGHGLPDRVARAARWVRAHLRRAGGRSLS